MTHIVFLTGSLLFIELASAAPAAQDQLSASSQPQSVCRSGTTVCVELNNECGAKTRGCYNACTPTTPELPSCMPTPSIPNPSITQHTVIFPAPSTDLPINSALFAEQIASPIIDVTFLSPSTLDIPTFTPVPMDPTATSSEGEHVTLVPDVIDVEAPIKASITTAATLIKENGNSVACGVKTECWDAITSLGNDCPRVRYGGCYDVCRGDPKTIFTPKPSTAIYFLTSFPPGVTFAVWHK